MAQYIQSVISGKPFGNGADGVYSSAGNATDAPVDAACTGTATQTSLSATNASFSDYIGWPILIHQTRGTGAGQWEINGMSNYSAGTITTSLPLAYSYASGAQVIVLKQYSSFTQNSSHTLTAKAWNGTVGGIITFACNGDVTISGTLTATGKGFRGGVGGNSSNSRQAYCGEGTAGATAQQNAANGNGGGGATSTATGNSWGGGGGGANAAGSGTGQAQNGATGGQAGSAVGAAALTTADFGGGGGGGSADGAGSVPTGATGGGFILIFAKNIASVNSITASGNDGVVDADIGSGAGGGGSVLIKAFTATLGATKIVATGGAYSNTTVDGGAGGTGRIHLDYGASYTGTTSPSLDVTNDPTLIETISGNILWFPGGIGAI